MRVNSFKLHGTFLCIKQLGQRNGGKSLSAVEYVFYVETYWLATGAVSFPYSHLLLQEQ